MFSGILSILRSLNFYEYILLFIPISLIFGPTYLNFFLILSSLIFLYEFYKKNFFNQIKFSWFFFCLIFICYNFIRAIYASDQMHALQSSFSQIRFLFFSLFIYLCIPRVTNINFILKFWLVVILAVAFDVLLQYYFSKDIFGYPLVGARGGFARPSGPFGESLRAGTFLSFTTIPIFFYYFNKFNSLTLKNKFIISIVYIFLFLVIAISGERLALVVFVSSSIVFLFFNFYIKKFLFFLLLIFIFLFSIFISNISFQLRMNELGKITTNFYESSYGRLWESSYLVFKQNKLFGVGLKNYRFECDNNLKPIDPRPDNPAQLCSTHPHNFILELLSETGIIGFLIFFIFFYKLLIFLRNRIKNLKNNFLFNEYKGLVYGNILMLFIYIWPLKTSGSFFTTWNGSFFWLNLGLALLLTKNNKI